MNSLPHNDPQSNKELPFPVEEIIHTDYGDLRLIRVSSRLWTVDNMDDNDYHVYPARSRAVALAFVAVFEGWL